MEDEAAAFVGVLVVKEMVYSASVEGAGTSEDSMDL
jgi:hypothetical protein